MPTAQGDSNWPVQPIMDSTVNTLGPIARRSLLMSDCVNLRSQLIAGPIDDRVRKSIEVIHAQPVIAVRPPPLVLD